MLRRVVRGCWVLIGLFIVAGAASWFAADHYWGQRSAAYLHENYPDLQPVIPVQASVKELDRKHSFYVILTSLWLLAGVVTLFLIGVLTTGSWVSRRLKPDIG